MQWKWGSQISNNSQTNIIIFHPRPGLISFCFHRPISGRAGQAETKARGPWRHLLGAWCWSILEIKDINLKMKKNLEHSGDKSFHLKLDKIFCMKDDAASVQSRLKTKLCETSKQFLNELLFQYNCYKPGFAILNISCCLFKITSLFERSLLTNMAMLWNDMKANKE